MELVGDPVVTDQDREMARAALVEGWNKCQSAIYRNPPKCDCDLGAIDGCKTRVEAIARWIAAARKM